MRLGSFLTTLIYLMLPTMSAAEIEVSVYVGQQSAPSSDVDIRDDRDIPDLSFDQDWEGDSFGWPIYGGFRVTNWQTAKYGYGLDFTHNKVRPNDGDLPAGFEDFEFTNGLNTFTLNGYRRWQNILGVATPYLGAGFGLSAPGVDVSFEGSETSGIQITGVAATWIAGVTYPVADDWSIFGEYKGTYTSNDIDLDGGGSLDTDIVTNALNVGVSFSF